MDTDSFEPQREPLLPQSLLLLLPLLLTACTTATPPGDADPYTTLPTPAVIREALELPDSETGLDSDDGVDDTGLPRRGISSESTLMSANGLSLISVNQEGEPANGESMDAAISGDGRRVVFWSEADDLTTGAISDTADAAPVAGIFLRGLEEGRTRLVGPVWDGASTALSERAAPAISADGRVVAYRAILDEGRAQGLMVAGLGAEPLRADLDPQGNPSKALSAAPALSGDGGMLAYHAHGNDLAAMDFNGSPDVFVVERARIEINDGDLPGGYRVVAGPWLVSRSGQESDPLRAASGASTRPWIDEEAGVVVFESDAADLVPMDTNGRSDVFAFTLPDGPMVRLSQGPDGEDWSGDSWGASVSADGRRVIFASSVAPAGEARAAADDATWIYQHDRDSGSTSPVLGPIPTLLEAEPIVPAISGDGGRVALALVEAEGDVRYTRIRVLDLGPDPEGISIVSNSVVAEVDLGADGFSGPFRLGRGALSRDGTRLVFSAGQALLPEDDNTVRDVYMVEIQSGSIETD